jgi:RecJ-like exonuclease
MTTKTYETTTDEVECLYCYGHGRIAVVSAYSRSFNDSQVEEVCSHCAGTGTITVTITADEWREAGEWLAAQEAAHRAETAVIAATFDRIEAELDALTGGAR